MGPGNCDSRHPVSDGNGVLTIISTYSNRFNNVEKTLTCANTDTKWAWCYGAPCTVDINDPKPRHLQMPGQNRPDAHAGRHVRPGQLQQGLVRRDAENDAFANKHFYNYMKKHHPDYPANPPALACFNKRI